MAKIKELTNPVLNPQASINPTTDIYRNGQRVSSIYFNMFKNICEKVFRWESAILKPTQIRRIERFLFEFGRCAIAPVISVNNGLEYNTGELAVFTYNPTTINWIRDESETITLTGLHTLSNIKKSFKFGEFAPISTGHDDITISLHFKQLSLLFADKLQRLDDVYNSKVSKLKMPIFAKVRNKSLLNSIKNLAEGWLFDNAVFSAVDTEALGNEDIFTEFDQTFLLDQVTQEKKELIREFMNYLGYPYQDQATGKKVGGGADDLFGTVLQSVTAKEFIHSYYLNRLHFCEQANELLGLDLKVTYNLDNVLLENEAIEDAGNQMVEQAGHGSGENGGIDGNEEESNESEQ